MYPAGHARNTTRDLEDILLRKFEMLGRLATDDPSAVIDRCQRLGELSAQELGSLYDLEIKARGGYE